MMNKKKTNNSMRVKYVLYVPMIVMLLIVSNIDSIARSVTNVTVDNKVAPVSVLQKQKSPDNDQKVYTVVSEMPKFNGNLFQWLAQNIKYPAEASQKHQQGTVMIKFVVEAMVGLDRLRLYAVLPHLLTKRPCASFLSCLSGSLVSKMVDQ